MHVSKRPWLLIPIETKARELHAKVLFSCFAADQGWGVIIGPRRVIRREQSWLPKGIIIEKSVSPPDERHILNSMKNGNFVTAWDEEGLIYLNKDDYLERRVSKCVLENLTMFFCWGIQQYNDLVSEPDIVAEKFFVTGNPRVDLLRKECRGIYANAPIPRKHVPYILVNTKFGTIIPNDAYSKNYSCYIEYLKATRRCATKRQETILQQFVALQRATLNSYLELVPALSRNFPDHTVIIRPHPSENNEFWDEATSHFANVQVVYSGSANEWIYSADAMIHSNCTTGVEAYLMEKPSISYLPVRSPEVESKIANDLSIRTNTVEETIDVLNKIISGKFQGIDQKEQREVAHRYIAAIKGKFASERILERIKTNISCNPSAFKCTVPLGDGFREILRFNKPINKRFFGLEKKEVLDIITLLKDRTKLFSNVKCAKVKKDTFCIYN